MPLAADGAGLSNAFGFSVAFSGDRALVGAVGENAGDTAAGAAYVFVRTANGWQQEARLVAPDGPDYYGFFGFSVALSGDRAFVTDQTSRFDLPEQGAVHVFVRSDAGWTYEAQLHDPDPSLLWIFGRSVSASGNRVLVGSLKEGGPGFDGAAHVFVRSGTTWSHEATLRSSPVVRYDEFGSSVSLLDDRALVGAIRDGTSGTDSGTAYLFTRTGSGWIQEARLSPARLVAGDRFGWSVSLGEGRALVGAPGTFGPTPTTRAGAAYTFVQTPGSAWALESWLGRAESDDGFGYSVSLVADQLLVGAPFGGATGGAHLFSRVGGGWQQTDVIAAADGAAEDRFGSAVALSGTRALVGADGADAVDRPGMGAAYVFSGVGTTDADSEPAARVALSPPWPNPATQRASLTLTLDRPQHVRATLVDALGRDVAVVLDAEVAGETRLDVNASRLPPGVYVVRVQGEMFTATRRLTVTR